MLRLSSQSKSMPLSRVAEYSATGMWTRPKLIAPFHRTRGAGADVAAVREEEADLEAMAKTPSILHSRQPARRAV